MQPEMTQDISLDADWRKISGIDTRKWIIREIEKNFIKSEYRTWCSQALPYVAEDGERMARQFGPPGVAVEEWIRRHGVTVHMDRNTCSAGGYVELAYYLEPTDIYINHGVVETVLRRLDKRGIPVPVLPWTEILLAHEYAHYLAIKEGKRLMFRQIINCVGRAPKRCRERMYRVLEEGYAMIFAEKWLGLDFSPFVLNAYTMLAFSPETARKELELLMKEE